jgi:hypothetical protein
LIALGGCFTSHLLAAIRAREIQISDLKVEVTGTLDGVPERFTEFTLTVSAKADDSGSLRKVVTIACRALSSAAGRPPAAPGTMLQHQLPILVESASSL